MAIKRFVAKNMRSALQMVRDTLGSDADILEEKWHEEGIEIVASSKDNEGDPSWSESTKILLHSAELAQKNREKSRIYDISDREKNALDKMLQEMREEIGTLRSLLDKPIHNMTIVQSAMIKRLLKMGLSLESAQHLVLQTLSEGTDQRMQEAWQCIVQAIERIFQYQPYDGFGSPQILAYHGLSGSGKTTALLSMACLVKMMQPRAPIVIASCVHKQVDPNASLRASARLLNIPFVLIETEQDYERLIQYYGQYLKAHIFIDSSFSDNLLESVWNNSATQPQIFLTIDATRQYQVLKKLCTMTPLPKVAGCIVTKIDESASLGQALSVIMETGIPIRFCTQSPLISGNLEGDAVSEMVNRWVHRLYHYQDAQVDSMAALI